MYEDLVELIENSNIVSFGPFGQGVSEEWIQKAEKRLGLDLPPSYRWWLKNYSGGEVGGEEIYSIYEIDFEEAVGGDIVFVALANQQNGLCGTEKLYICDTGVDEGFYFDTTQKNDAGEYKVYSLDNTDGSFVLYADNFIEFLKKRISFFGK
jgi:hypothetical protein